MLRNIFLAFLLISLSVASVGTASAIIPATTSGCGGEWSHSSLLFAPYTYDDGYAYAGPMEINVPSRGGKMVLDEEGHAMWEGAVATAPWTLHFTYFIEMPDGTDFMAPMAGVTVAACEIPEPPLCDFAPLRPEKIEISEPVEMGQEIEVDYIRLPSGDVETNVYMDGIEKTQWDGESCIIAEVWLNGVLYARNGMEMLD